MLLQRIGAYQISIHVLLVALAATVLGLVHENRSLRNRPLAPAPTRAQLQDGDTISPFSVQELDGSSELLSLEGSERESLLFVFTTVCPSCKENQQKWRSLYEQVNERYEVVGVSLNDLEVTANYRETHDLPFRVVVPEDIRGFATGNQIHQVPLTVLVGRDGKVLRSWLGVLSEVSLSQLATFPASAVNG